MTGDLLGICSIPSKILTLNFLQAIKKRPWGKTANNCFRMREEYKSSPNINF